MFLIKLSVSLFYALPQNRFEEIEHEIRAEFQNLHRFLDEEEETDLERLSKERDRRVKILKEREKKIGMQSRDLEKAIETLNCKLREDDSPKLLKVDFHFKLYKLTD